MIKWRLILMLLSPDDDKGGGDNPPDDKTKNPDGKTDETNLELAKRVKALTEENAQKDKKITELSDENKKLYEDFINGEGGGGGDNGQHTPDQAAIKTELDNEVKELMSIQSAGMNNLEYVQKTLSIRKKMMDLGMPDPFLPKGHDLKPTDDDKEKAQHTADVFEQCIKAANGDSDLFTAQLQSRTNEDSPIIKNFIAKMKAQKKSKK